MPSNYALIFLPPQKMNTDYSSIPVETLLTQGKSDVMYQWTSMKHCKAKPIVGSCLFPPDFAPKAHLWHSDALARETLLAKQSD